MNWKFTDDSRTVAFRSNVDGSMESALVSTLPQDTVVDAAALDTTWRDVIWTSFRALRDVYLYRLEGIAGRAYRSGDEAFASALDVFIQGVLDMPAHPSVQPDVATTATKLSKAINARFSELKNTAVGYDPATALIAFPDRKAIIDKVFK